jgi:hypothetical protein
MGVKKRPPFKAAKSREETPERARESQKLYPFLILIQKTCPDNSKTLIFA